MIDSSIYGGGLFGPTIRTGREPVSPILGSREGGLPRPRPTLLQPRPVTKPVAKPVTGGVKPKPKPPAKPKKKANPLDKVWQVPTLEIPTLVTPDLDVLPELEMAALEDFNITPIEIGPLPTLEAAPDASPTVRMPDRSDASIRRAKLAEIARIKAMRGYGSTLLSGARGDTRRVQARRGG